MKTYTTLDAVAPQTGAQVGKVTVEVLHEVKPPVKKTKIKGKPFFMPNVASPSYHARRLDRIPQRES